MSARRIESTVGVGETAEYWKGVLVAELLRTISNKVLAYADIRQGLCLQKQTTIIR